MLLPHTASTHLDDDLQSKLNGATASGVQELAHLKPLVQVGNEVFIHQLRSEATEPAYVQIQNIHVCLHTVLLEV